MPELICPICGKKRYRHPSEIHHKCCSNKCGQHYRFLNVAQRVGEERLSYLYLTKQKSFRKISQITGVNIKTLRKMARHFKIPIRHGSEAVKTQWENNQERKKYQAEILNKNRPDEAWNKGLTKNDHSSLQKISEQRNGKGNPCYKDGSTPYYKRLRTQSPHRKWSRTVKKRDGYKCTKCGNRKQLHAHHIKSFRKDTELRYDVDNGITLCKDCHWNLHRKD